MSNKAQIQSLIVKKQWRDAHKLCVNFCSRYPRDAEGWFLLGAVAGKIGAFEESEKACVRSLELHPNMPVTLCNLGIAQREQGKINESVSSFRQALKLKPDFSEGCSELSVALRLLNQLDEAADLSIKAFNLNPSNVFALLNLAAVRVAQEKAVEALSILQQALHINSNFAEAHLALGKLLRDSKRLDDAIVHFRQAVRLQPFDAFAWNALGGALMARLGAHYSQGEPERCYREAIRLQPSVPEFRLNLGVLLREQGKHEEALATFRKAVDLRPDYEAAIAGVAQVLEHLGDYQGAFGAIQPLLKKDTTESTVALAYSSVARHMNQREEAITLLENLVQLSKPARESSSMHFALGKLYDSTKQYDKAFAHIEAAHRVESFVYDPESTKIKFDQLIEVFSKENLSWFPRATNRSDLPIFIVGMPRSGTSLVEQILASHPDVYGAGELEHVHGMTALLSNMLGGKVDYPSCVKNARRRHIDELTQRHLAILRKFSKTAKRVTDKMPHNFIELGLIELLFPGARVIHCKRDPIDTCFSIYGLPFNDSHPYTGTLEHLGGYYCEYSRLMKHWKSVLSLPILEVTYEDLVADQERISREMVEFCGLSWDERCLNFHEANRVVTTHSYDQVRRPIYKQSVARWKNYEAFLQPLVNSLKLENKAFEDSAIPFSRPLSAGENSHCNAL